MLKGADFSKYQGTINWDSVKAGLDFAIVKATEGDPDPGQSVAAYEDPNFKLNQSEMRRVGILRGFYHFARPDFNEPEGEAQEFFDAVGGFQEGEVSFLDLEVFTVKDGSSPVDWALRWLNFFEKLSGNKGVMYLSASRTTAYDWSPVVNAGHGLWVADYGVNDGTEGSGNFATGAWATAAFWQYTSKGNAAGMVPVDLDNFYGDVAAFQKYGYHDPIIEETTTTTTTELPEPETTTTTTTETTQPVIVPPMEPTTTTTTTTETVLGAPAPTPVKPGYLTSEFWMTLFVHAFALLTFVAGLNATGNQYVNYAISGAGALIALINQLGYTSSRTQVKVSAADNSNW